jgi:xylulokinase
MSLLGLDVGTTGCKAVAFNDKGEVIASAYKEYPLIHPREDWVELNPDQIWESVQEVIFKTNRQTREDPVSALSVSSQGESTVAIDRKGDAVHNFIVTFDNRTLEQMHFWENKLSREKIYKITGMPLHPMYSINKIMWIKKNNPEIYDITHKFLLAEDFVIFKLTGEFGIDYSLASRTMAFDVREKKWSSEILETADVSERLLSAVYPSGTIVGKVRDAIGTKLGFIGSIPVATGGHDQPCGALGAGISASDIAMNATGTVDAICPVFDRFEYEKGLLDDNYAVYPYVAEPLYCSIGFNLTAGLLLKWYRDTFGQEEVRRARELGTDVYDIIFEEMAHAPKDIYILPHFVGSGTPYLDPLSKGAITGLKISNTKADIIRGIVDSINYEMKLNIERLSENNILLREIRAVGGGAKSSKWLVLKASCFGIPIKKPMVNEAVSLGAAILAGYATGVFETLGEGVKSMVHIESQYEPDVELMKLYEEKFRIYKRLYHALKPFNDGIG